MPATRAQANQAKIDLLDRVVSVAGLEFLKELAGYAMNLYFASQDAVEKAAIMAQLQEYYVSAYRVLKKDDTLTYDNDQLKNDFRKWVIKSLRSADYDAHRTSIPQRFAKEAISS